MSSGHHLHDVGERHRARLWAPDPCPLAARRIWLLPAILIVALAAVLPTKYFRVRGPPAHLKNLAVALVVAHQGESITPGVAVRAAGEIASPTVDAVKLIHMDRVGLAQAVNADRLAGVVVIPAHSDSAIGSLLPGASTAVVPTITTFTTPGTAASATACSSAP